MDTGDVGPTQASEDEYARLCDQDDFYVDDPAKLIRKWGEIYKDKDVKKNAQAIAAQIEVAFGISTVGDVRTLTAKDLMEDCMLPKAAARRLAAFL